MVVQSFKASTFNRSFNDTLIKLIGLKLFGLLRLVTLGMMAINDVPIPKRRAPNLKKPEKKWRKSSYMTLNLITPKHLPLLSV